ncbi:MucBP domain-containing protein, partial [Streptococcus suis]
KTGDVVARYVLEGTETELAPSTTVKDDAPVDEAYSDQAPERLEKDGKVYELVRTRANDGDAPATGSVTEGTQTITYEYKEVTPAVVTGNVDVAYVTEDGEVLEAVSAVKTDA